MLRTLFWRFALPVLLVLSLGAWVLATQRWEFW